MGKTEEVHPRSSNIRLKDIEQCEDLSQPEGLTLTQKSFHDRSHKEEGFETLAPSFSFNLTNLFLSFP